MLYEYQGLLETFCCRSEYFKCAHDVKSVVWLSMRLDDVTLIVCVCQCWRASSPGKQCHCWYSRMIPQPDRRTMAADCRSKRSLTRHVSSTTWTKLLRAPSMTWTPVPRPLTQTDRSAQRLLQYRRNVHFYHTVIRLIILILDNKC